MGDPGDGGPAFNRGSAAIRRITVARSRELTHYGHLADREAGFGHFVAHLCGVLETTPKPAVNPSAHLRPSIAAMDLERDP